MIRKTLIIVFSIILLLITIVFLIGEFYMPPLPENHGKLDVQLFEGDLASRALVVGFGGGEGGNSWASDYWKSQRDSFLSERFAFLAVGYFGTPTTPEYLDRISLNAIRDTILKTANSLELDGGSIGLIGGSKGGELVLNLAAYFDDFKAVVALVPAHVSFPALTILANTSSWSLNDNEVPFVEAPYSTIIPALKGNLLAAHSGMLQCEACIKTARIPLEKTTADVLLISATRDNQWPSNQMSKEIEKNMKTKSFIGSFEHLQVEGEHDTPLKYISRALVFLKNALITESGVEDIKEE